MKPPCRLWIELIALLASFCGVEMADGQSFESVFRLPPIAASPAIWWYWGESVTTEHGITQDLEALKRVGFGGVVIYEQVFADKPDALKILSPEWLVRVRIADAALPPGQRLTWTSWSPFRAGDPLLPSGLLGPVQIRTINAQP